MSAIHTRTIMTRTVGALALIVMTMTGCASLSYYSGSASDKTQIKDVLLVHAQSVISGHVPGHAQTHTPGAMTAGPFTGDPAVQARAMTPDALARMGQSPADERIPPEREVVGRVRLTRMKIRFMTDQVATVTFREVGFDGRNLQVFQHDVAAFLSKEGREWKIYAMAAGEIMFDRQGLEQYWYLAPSEVRSAQEVPIPR
ncbi:MAG: hypothetical protein HY710_04230 [Candidatus Latescibacteria bacterium]|nr:hypothetical protein [Candidatus Latescibacterota bacterium]